MLTALDHIIIGVNNLEQAAHIFSEKLGLTVSGGGNHPEGGTANRIIVIGDTYIELIAVRNPAEAQESMLKRLAQSDGLLNVVFASDDIQTDTAAMKQRGISIIGPREGKLTSADGYTRGWMRTDIERPELAQHYPFLIQHDSTGEERRTRLAGGKTPPEHPLGATKILSATLVVEDLREAIERFQRIYGMQASKQFTGDVDGWDALLVAFLLRGSLQSFELATPIPVLINPSDDTGHLPEPGTLTSYLQRFGESLCRITLAVDSLEKARDYLDAHEVVYTYQEEVRPVVWISPVEACGVALVLHAFTPEIPPSFPLSPEDTTI
jgi:catechol 2,3-dioxygenase-like lactoylglutathione lyase family enzyme